MRHLIETIAVLATTTIANADLQLWSGTATNVNITGDTAEILAAGTYKFQSVDGSGNLAGIDLIHINASVTGIVTVHIARNPAESADPNGAESVGELRLNVANATYTGNLAELRITGELGVDAESKMKNLTGGYLKTAESNRSVQDRCRNPENNWLDFSQRMQSRR